MTELGLNDLQAAAFIVAKGFPLVRAEGPPYRKTFVFQHVPDELVSEFYAGKADVNASRVFEAYRTLRAIARQALQDKLYKK